VKRVPASRADNIDNTFKDLEILSWGDAAQRLSLHQHAILERFFGIELVKNVTCLCKARFDFGHTVDPPFISYHFVPDHRPIFELHVNLLNRLRHNALLIERKSPWLV
jgi:hypothetical protein